jgi:hypothetical protein
MDTCKWKRFIHCRRKTHLVQAIIQMSASETESHTDPGWETQQGHWVLSNNQVNPQSNTLALKSKAAFQPFMSSLSINYTVHIRILFFLIKRGRKFCQLNQYLTRVKKKKQQKIVNNSSNFQWLVKCHGGGSLILSRARKFNFHLTFSRFIGGRKK